MRFNEFCHIIRAASRIANDTEIVCVGSQAILAQFPDAPEELLVSMELDLYPRQKPEDSELVDGAIGYLSDFHYSFGYYADGVDERLQRSLQIGNFERSKRHTRRWTEPVQ